MREAYSRKTAPALVREASPFALSISGVPISFSNALIFWLTAGWLMPMLLAALVKLPVSATAMNTFSLKSSNIFSSLFRKNKFNIFLPDYINLYKLH